MMLTLGEAAWTIYRDSVLSLQLFYKSKIIPKQTKKWNLKLLLLQVQTYIVLIFKTCKNVIYPKQSKNQISIASTVVRF